MSGQEAITKRLMDGIVISKHAEGAYQRRLRRAGGAKRRSMTSEATVDELAVEPYAGRKV
jgi:hypothetical protein